MSSRGAAAPARSVPEGGRPRGRRQPPRTPSPRAGGSGGSKRQWTHVLEGGGSPRALRPGPSLRPRGRGGRRRVPRGLAGQLSRPKKIMDSCTSLAVKNQQFLAPKGINKCAQAVELASFSAKSGWRIGPKIGPSYGARCGPQNQPLILVHILDSSS